MNSFCELKQIIIFQLLLRDGESWRVFEYNFRLLPAFLWFRSGNLYRVIFNNGFVRLALSNYYILYAKLTASKSRIQYYNLISFSVVPDCTQ